MDIIYDQSRGIATYISEEGIQEIELPADHALTSATARNPLQDRATEAAQARRKPAYLEECESAYRIRGILIT